MDGCKCSTKGETVWLRPQQTSRINTGNEQIARRWKRCGSSLISARCRRPKSSDKNWWKCKCEMEVRGMRLCFRWFLNGRKSPLCNEPSLTNERTPSDNETSAEVKQRGPVWDTSQPFHTWLQPLFRLCYFCPLDVRLSLQSQAHHNCCWRCTRTLYEYLTKAICQCVSSIYSVACLPGCTIVFLNFCWNFETYPQCLPASWYC